MVVNIAVLDLRLEFMMVTMCARAGVCIEGEVARLCHFTRVLIGCPFGRGGLHAKVVLKLAM
jgi:hypothetical protein